MAQTLNQQIPTFKSPHHIPIDGIRSVRGGPPLFTAPPTESTNTGSHCHYFPVNSVHTYASRQIHCNLLSYYCSRTCMQPLSLRDLNQQHHCLLDRSLTGRITGSVSVHRQYHGSMITRIQLLTTTVIDNPVLLVRKSSRTWTFH